MSATHRIPHLATAFLLAASACVAAESPMPDPIAPAVIGRPLDQIRPVRPAAQKAVVAPTERPGKVAAGNKAAPKAPATRVVAAPAAQSGPLTLVPTPAAAQAAAKPGEREAKQAVDDRIDTRAMGAMSPVGQGTHFARKPLASGAYFSSRHQAMVRKYYETHPAAGKAAPSWKIGEPLPPKAALSGVPDGVRATLPPLPPGHQYVQVDGEVVLVAMQSRMVVDGVSRAVR